ncbi:Sorbitol-6-phosphate 2-dehydrogenase [Acidisarcina polymorpha]|uniref:Sorbitol-6-phosphate 2-dehydrogenase n=1 Tax=Acidisarcina polymorpha TaxID=2211140 RepID=A0A2Z5FX35_9BACT|nr:SDR family oxidoreductase [Acidisarcina polymorpha]AXC10945.1 Sorbitol-6-phosphate 2-dehydrogenase [Acidisarcina polymorpha]
MYKPYKRPTGILVLGATSSIAMAFSRLLARPDTHFFLVARNPRKLNSVASDLLTRGAASVVVHAMDLDETPLHPAMLSEAAASLGNIDLALIAHGVLGIQEEAQAHYEAASAILTTNFLSPVSLVTWLANYFEGTRQGTLAVISSVAGDRGRKSNYLYGASKGGLNIFLNGVRNRIDRAGVQVLTIRPGFVATPMTAHLPQGPLFATPTAVAHGILRAMQTRRDIAYVPGFWAAIMFVIRAIPEAIFKNLDL